MSRGQPASGRYSTRRPRVYVLIGRGETATAPHFAPPFTPGSLVPSTYQITRPKRVNDSARRPRTRSGIFPGVAAVPTD